MQTHGTLGSSSCVLAVWLGRNMPPRRVRPCCLHVWQGCKAQLAIHCTRATAAPAHAELHKSEQQATPMEPSLNHQALRVPSRAGVIQMNVGIILSFLNQRYFRDSLSTYCEFIPQMIFLNGLFGYLCLLIVGKWISGSTADLYHVMIYMFLSPGSGGLMCADGQGNYGCAENRMFPGQGPLQVGLGF